MSGSEGGYPGIFSDLHFDVQIDTKLFRAESPVIQGFQRFAFSFNRTVVSYDTQPYRRNMAEKHNFSSGRYR
jgi:hypothetical protein